MTLLDLCTLLKRKLWLVIGLPIACALVAGIVVWASPAEYSASATITTNAEPAGVGAFATDAAAQFSDGATTITAATNTSTRVITLTAEGGSQEQAIKLVNKAANTAFLKAFDRYNPTVGDSPIMNVTMNLKFAETAKDISPGVAKTAAIALIAGLFVAICIVVIMDMARGNIHSARDLEEDYELRLLGRLRKGAEDGAGSATGRNAAGVLAREQLFANVRFASGEHKSVCALSMDDEALSAQTSIELAEAAKQAGRRALVIDADMNGTSILAAELGTGAGLAAVLDDEEQLDGAVRDARGFAYLPAGSPKTAPAALLDSERLAHVLQQAALEYDLVIVNAAPAAQRADFSYLSHAAGSTVLCVREFATKRKELEGAAARLAIADANVIGFVATA